uniref:Putative conserved secreted protein midgut overexpressed n=1 Tax=Rhipicephalus microplus TaxID=6941 RepID=A0A6M2CH98_RHIMP
MNARLLSVGLLVLAMLTVVASDPECPLINCVAGSRVGCLITKERCRCFCVQEQDPCQYVKLNYGSTCAPNERISCTLDDNTCKCQCGKFLSLMLDFCVYLLHSRINSNQYFLKQDNHNS